MIYGFCHPLIFNSHHKNYAFGVSQMSLSNRIRITVKSVLEETDKDRKYLKVNVK